MNNSQIICGDTLEEVRKLPSDSIDCVITSPPYYQLRDYGFDGQWGLEKTYQEYLDKMIALMAELKRVLKPTGTMWINCGDTYSNRGANTQPTHTSFGKLTHTGRKQNTFKAIGFPNKCLLLIPHRFAIRCVDELGLILRNDIIWAKRNGMPESVTDRFSKKHEFIFFFVKQQKYFFDLDGVRDKTITGNGQSFGLPTDKRFGGDKNAKGKISFHLLKNHINGKNPGDVSDFWDIPTKPCSEKHYATFNTDLINKPIIAGCPEFVCTKCGKPREKIIVKEKRDKPYIYAAVGILGENKNRGQRNNHLGSIKVKGIKYKTCNCNAGFEGGVILDPFCGIGTTLVRGLQLGRKVIGIDGKKLYCDIAEKRIYAATQQIN